MTQAFEIAGVGLSSQQQALEVIANNVANINTPSFKRSDLRFSEVVSQLADPANLAASLAQPPSLAGVTAQPTLMLNLQGDLEITSRPLDIAIDGEGFIELMGTRGDALLWRGGSLAVDEEGLLTTQDGLPLRAMISVPDGASNLRIDAAGLVSATIEGAAEPQVLGQMSLVRVLDPALVERLDGGLYRVLDDAAIEPMDPAEPGGGAFVQGALEQSNVNLNDEMVQLLIIQRAFAANAQVLQAADQIMALANNLRK